MLALVIFAGLSLIDWLNGMPEQTQQSNQQTPGGYQNEGVAVPAPAQNPPPLPEPQTYAQATQWMQQNSLYDQAVAVPVRCDLVSVDGQTASTTQLQQDLNDLTECLMRVWTPPLQAAGFQAVRPPVTVYSGQVRTPCGTMPMRNAAYCAADQRIYYATDLPESIPPQLVSTPFMPETVVAHEFGHAIQARSGILISEAAWQQQVSSTQGLELSRRTEVQADCFAGEFINSISQSQNLTAADRRNLGLLFYSIGDDVLTGDPNKVGNHGRGVNRQAWFNAGLANPQLSTCNSFTAPADTVR